MPVVIPPPIDALPPAPDPNNRATFNTLAYHWSAALPGFGAQVSAVGANVKANADDAALSAIAANVSKAAADADAVATAADRVQTGLDRVAASALVGPYLGSQATDPATGGGGASLVSGNWYINTTTGFIRAYTMGGGWVNSVSAIAGVSSVNGNTGAVALKTINGEALTGSGNILTGASIFRSARTSNAALSAVDKGNLIDITSGTFTQTFAAAATLSDGWWCYLRNSGTGVITLDPNASETIDGAATRVLDPGQSVIVQCDGTALRTVAVSGAGRHEVVLRTGNGRGSTNTRIRRFTTSVVNVGTAITYADSATLGATFTINEHGAYSIIYQDDLNNGSSSGISKNSSQLTTPINSISSSDVLAFAFSASVPIVPISAVVRCVPGDVIRAHTENSNTDTNVMFSIRRVSL